MGVVTYMFSKELVTYMFSKFPSEFGINIDHVPSLCSFKILASQLITEIII